MLTLHNVNIKLIKESQNQETFLAILKEKKVKTIP